MAAWKDVRAKEGSSGQVDSGSAFCSPLEMGVVLNQYPGNCKDTEDWSREGEDDSMVNGHNNGGFNDMDKGVVHLKCLL